MSTGTAPEDAPGTKRCLYCAEVIQAAAIVCRFCNRDLRQAAPTSPPYPQQHQYRQPLPSRPPAGSPNQWRMIAWAVGGLLGLGVVANLIDPPKAEPPPPMPQKVAAEPRASRPTTPPPPPVPAPKPTVAAGRTQAEALKELSATLGTIDPSGNIFVRVEPGINEMAADVIVGPAWHYEPKGVRQELAQSLWNVWVKCLKPNEVDQARIKIRDQSGNDLGGSSWLAGSLVSVKD